ncbi:MAG: NAD-dependent epimerase/dehydratase family protein [Ignavibacteria bacterium]
MNILITGGAGFIGSNICDKYLAEGHNLFVLDNLSNGRENNISTGVKLFNKDIYSDNIEFIFKENNIDVVNHHAAQIDLRYSIKNPLHDARINIEGSLKLLDLSVKYEVKKFIFASSGGSIYGEQKDFPATEEHKIAPISPYGITKSTIENYILFYNKFYGLNYVILRYSNAYGERQGSKGDAGVISIFCKSILSNKQPVVFGNGLNTRDFLYVKDIVNANLLALNFKGNDVFNISSGKETSIKSLAENIISNLNPEAKVNFGDEIEGEQKRSVLSNAKAKSILKWEPLHTFDEGLKLTCKWFKEYSKD